MEVQRGLYSGPNPHLYAGVPQHAYAITTANSSRPILFTCHVVTCMAISLYDRKRKIGALLHVDLDTTNTIRKIFEKLKNQGVQLNELEVQMIGGLRTGDKVEEEARHNCNCLKNEILLKTSHIQEKIFENVYLSEEDEIKISQPSDISDNEMEEVVERWNRSRYTQIALDSLSGEVLISSDFDYLAFPLENESYSRKARDWQKKLDLMFFSGDSKRIAKIAFTPLEKVYDATKNKNYYSI